MTVRMDSQVKSNFDLLCSRLGMSANTAMNLFVNAAIQHQGIPFEVRLYANSRRKDAVKNYMNEEDIRRGWEAYSNIRGCAESGMLPDLSLDEINEEINLARIGK